nr:MAG TPA: DNA primase [Crassvirales sp.]
MISKGRPILGKRTILSKIDEVSLLKRYLSVKRIPCLICSPLREDKHPSFSIYKTANGHIKYYDYATLDKGNIFDLLMSIYHLSFKEVLLKVWEDAHLNITPISLKIPSSPISESYVSIRSIRREWEEKDFKYWESYGVCKRYLLHSDIYPISHYMIITPTYNTLIKADKIAYTYIERKEGHITEKIYQPFNKDGYKWRSNHDSSVIDLWCMLPLKGEKLIITSSRKDALCLWSNLHIPSISPQSESTSLNPKVIRDLKKRFKKVYVLYDNDFNKSFNTGVTDGKKLCDTFNLTYIEIPKEYSSKDPSDLYKNKGKQTFMEVMEWLLK